MDPILLGRGGERIILRINAVANEKIEKPIIGLLLKNDKGLTLLGDNTLNSRTQLFDIAAPTVDKGQPYCAEFEFTLPLLPKGKYSFTISLAEGSQLSHNQLQWMNDALVFESVNCCIAAGLAGVPMHRISLQSGPY
jgi:lipopolysaccharide transport system ATP-binding protein